MDALQTEISHSAVGLTSLDVDDDDDEQEGNAGDHRAKSYTYKEPDAGDA
jgi:hypothetical protein